MNNERRIKKKLISYFSKRSTKEAESDEGKKTLIKNLGMKNWEELLQNKDYLQNYEPIRQLRDELDKNTEGLEGIHQVQSCLALFKDKKRKKQTEDIKILKTFIKNANHSSFYETWDEEHQNLYNEGLSLILEWKDFFFSYTTRNLPETNNTFKELIIQSYNEDDFNKTKDKINFLAKSIVRYFNMINLHSFYDQDNITCGDIIEEEILANCNSCFVFVQLVETEIFHELVDKKNWCYEEFNEFVNSIKQINNDKKRMHFFILHGEELVFPPGIPPPLDYKKWQEKIKATSYLKIIDKMTNLDLQRKVIEVGKEIFSEKNKILSKYLGEFT